jgi:predicted transcriptional regulator YdeE
MEINLVGKETFFICGYSVETTLEQNDKDISALYDDFFRNNKEAF